MGSCGASGSAPQRATTWSPAHAARAVIDSRALPGGNVRLVNHPKPGAVGLPMSNLGCCTTSEAGRGERQVLALQGRLHLSNELWWVR